ncbi:MAG TPA: efflux RND transporter periplasmic adaptor subunit [Candidatus Binataceae bacterium]|nr:efflux RND transporter periplasmic adaptor subunit [Candidatus Binataceae bacterium]
MKPIARRMLLVFTLLIVGALFYYLGGKYLWPAPDRSTIRTVGIVEAPEVNVSSRIAGRITSLPLLEGDVVETGQVVCRIEDVDIRNQLAKARADLADARAEANEAERTSRRDQELFANNVISVQARDDAATKVDKDRAAMESALANVSYYQDQLTDTQVRSPISGVVVSKNLEAGEWVNPGTSILTIDDLSTLWARVDVEETDLGFIHVGSPAQIALMTIPRTLLSGQVMAIGQEGQFATETDVRRGRQDIRTFYVKVRVLQPVGVAKPGMTAEVTLRRQNASQLSSN